MGLYARYVLPRLIDLAMQDRPMGRQRRKIVPTAEGRVLEIGIGSGSNLPYYEADRVSELIGLEPSQELSRMAQKASEDTDLGRRFRLLSGVCEEIPLDSDSVDTVVMTYTLCSIGRTEEALRELGRVMKPSARLVFSEHGLAPDPGVRRIQAVLNPLWKRIAGGCHLNRDIPALLRKAGFRIQDLEELYLPGPRPLRFNYLGVARVS